MNNKREIDYLKRKVKRTYKWYTGERTDGTATIADVAKLFKLPIDEENLSDYEIKSFDSKIPSIEILCKKDNYTYYAEYSASSKLLGYHSFEEEKFINHIINYSDKLKRETTLSLLWGDNYYDVFSVKLNERYTLFLIRYASNSYSTLSPESTETVIALDDKECHYRGIDKLVYNIRRPQTKLYEFEMEEMNLSDVEYQYNLSNGIVYFKLDHSRILRNTLFCENVFKGMNRYFPCNFQIEETVEVENKSLINDQVYSTIFFRGRLGILKIFKKSTNFKIEYTKRSTQDFSIEDFEYTIPVLNFCAPIDYMECEYLENEIAKFIKDENVLKKVQARLKEIKFRLMVSKGIAKKEESILYMKKYSDIPFEEAMKLVVENKDEIFSEILKRLEKND